MSLPEEKKKISTVKDLICILFLKTKPTSSHLSLHSSASQEDAVHVVIDRHLITGQNMESTSLAVNNLILLCSAK